jgi:hypothetical protein
MLKEEPDESMNPTSEEQFKVQSPKLRFQGSAGFSSFFHFVEKHTVIISQKL